MESIGTESGEMKGGRDGGKKLIATNKCQKNKFRLHRFTFWNFSIPPQRQERLKTIKTRDEQSFFFFKKRF